MKKHFRARAALILALSACSLWTPAALAALRPTKYSTPSETRKLPAGGLHPTQRGPSTVLVTIPRGRSGTVILRSHLSSETNHRGDGFTAVLPHAWVVRGTTVLPRGTRVFGRVVDVEHTGRGKHKAELGLKFERLGLPNGKTVAIASRSLWFKAGGETKRDVALIGGGTVIGGLIGHATGSTGKGAVIGAAAGTGAALVARGKPIVLGSGHALTLTLRQPVRVPVRVSPRRMA